MSGGYDEALKRIRWAQEGASELLLSDLMLQHLPPDLGELPALTRLRLDGCSGLEDIPALERCTGLLALELRACPRVLDLSPLRGLQALEELWLGSRNRDSVGLSEEHISTLASLVVLTQLLALRVLTVVGCHRVSDFQALATLTGLQDLDLSECEQVRDLQPLQALTALQSLDVSRCRGFGTCSHCGH